MPDYSINIKYLTDSEYVDVYLRIELDQSYSGAGCGAWEVPVELLALALRQVEAFVKVYDEILEAAA
ncbi:hypothetical protein [Calothrix sp. NIES-2100]|uniref:hypothetical protein n=1 Tax=Calothrix sp. NIES-2100 TaxID=1954172 RepID=UPI0030D98101